MEWEVIYIEEKDMLEFKHHDATTVLGLQDLQALDGNTLAFHLTELLNDLAKA